MKPQPPFRRGRSSLFPVTDYCFQGDLSGWRGASWPGDEDDSPARRFNRFNREFRREVAREREREWRMFSFMMAISAWPVFYMIYCVIRLLLRRHGVDI